MKHSKNIKRRAVAIYLFMILLALVIIIQPLYTQIFESHYTIQRITMSHELSQFQHQEVTFILMIYRF